MQDGIGRGGYRLLSSVFVGIGVLGIATTLVAFEQAGSPRGLFDWLGFALTFVALAALYALTLVILWRPAAVEPVSTATPIAGAPPAAPTRNLNFEFADLPEDLEDGTDSTGPEVAVPMPAARPLPAPSPPVVQPNRNLERDTKGWPRRQPPSGLTLGERRTLERKAAEMLATGEEEATIEFTGPRAAAAPSPTTRPTFRPAPTFRTEPRPAGRQEMAIRAAPSGSPRSAIPTAIARVAAPNDDPSWSPPGTTKGQCSGCGVLLYAGAERPLNLRCPKCGKVTLLA